MAPISGKKKQKKQTKKPKNESKGNFRHGLIQRFKLPQGSGSMSVWFFPFWPPPNVAIIPGLKNSLQQSQVSPHIFRLQGPEKDRISLLVVHRKSRKLPGQKPLVNISPLCEDQAASSLSQSQCPREMGSSDWCKPNRDHSWSWAVISLVQHAWLPQNDMGHGHRKWDPEFWRKKRNRCRGRGPYKCAH